MKLKYEQTKILKIDVEKMFSDYSKNAQKKFENEVYLKLKKVYKCFKRSTRQIFS